MERCTVAVFLSDGGAGFLWGEEKLLDCLFSSGSPSLSKFPDSLKIPDYFPTCLFEGRERQKKEKGIPY